jgi:hypothetical protein
LHDSTAVNTLIGVLGANEHLGSLCRRGKQKMMGQEGKLLFRGKLPVEASYLKASYLEANF